MIYGRVMQFRNRLFDKGLLKSEKLPVPVVSIGNITVGGTGKSPMTRALIKSLLDSNIKVGVVSRGYGRKTTGVLEVDLKSKDAAVEFGDEPCMLKNEFPQVPIFVGEDRFKCAGALLSKYGVKLLLADDAFQHRQLQRDLDIVMLDAMRPERDYRALPFGRAREPFSGLKRAQFVIINKTNFVDEKQVEDLRSRVAVVAPQAQIILAKYQFSRCRSATGLELASGPAFIFAGLAQPESFKELLRSRLQIVGLKFFKDHHAYSVKDWDDLCDAAKKLGTTNLVTSPKDAVKLKGFASAGMNLFVCEMDMEFDSGIQILKERLVELAR